MKLYGFSATRSLRALWALKELGLDFDYVPIDLTKGEHRSPEFLEINPAGKLPVLVDGDLVLPESAAIILYLAEKHPEKAMIPADLKERAEMYRWIMFAVTELEQPLWRITKHSFILPEERRSPAEIALAREDFLAMGAILDRHMANRAFLLGDRISAADCVTAWLMDWANEYSLIGDFPHLQAYMTRLYQRPTAPPRIAQARKAA